MTLVQRLVLIRLLRFRGVLVVLLRLGQFLTKTFLEELDVVVPLLGPDEAAVEEASQHLPGLLTDLL